MSAAPDKLSLVVFSGTFDKVYYALVLASGAVAVGKPVTLFFTMEACRALARPDGNGVPGWRRLAGAEADDAFATRGIATFDELLDACVQLGARLIVCEMGLKAIGMGRNELRDDIDIDIAGVVTFLNDASRHGGMLFI